MQLNCTHMGDIEVPFLLSGGGKLELLADGGRPAADAGLSGVVDSGEAPLGSGGAAGEADARDGQRSADPLRPNLHRARRRERNHRRAARRRPRRVVPCRRLRGVRIQSCHLFEGEARADAVAFSGVADLKTPSHRKKKKKQ